MTSHWPALKWRHCWLVECYERLVHYYKNAVAYIKCQSLSTEVVSWEEIHTYMTVLLKKLYFSLCALALVALATAAWPNIDIFSVSYLLHVPGGKYLIWRKKKLIELRWDDHFQLDELFAPMLRLFLYHELVKVMNCIKYGQSCINLENFSTITFQFKLYSNILTCSIYSDACFSHTGLEIP